MMPLKKSVVRDPEILSGTIEDVTKSGYEHFTLKEIHEQPKLFVVLCFRVLMMTMGRLFLKN